MAQQKSLWLRVHSFKVARLGVPFSWNYGQRGRTSLGNVVQSGIRQTFLEHVPDQADQAPKGPSRSDSGAASHTMPHRSLRFSLTRSFRCLA
jgi:hypothetical protein